MSALLLFAIAGALVLLPLLFAVGLAVEVARVDIHALMKAVGEVMKVVRPWLAW